MIDREPHVSDLRWDQLLAGELTGPSSDTIRAHATTCAACETRFRELAAGRDAFALRASRVGVHPRARARWWWAVPVVALAAAIVIVVVRAPRDDTGERTKGSGTTLVLVAGRPGDLAPVADGDPLHPGDYLQAGYTASRDGYGAVLALDGTGSAYAYVPSSGATMIALPSGSEQSFPESTVLDSVLGTEIVVVLWCPRAHVLQPLLESLHATHAVPAPEGCAQRTVRLEKQAAR